MHAAGRFGFRALALATVAGLALAAGPVLAQKGQPQQGAGPALPTAKPPPLGAPMQAQPAPRPAPPAPRSKPARWTDPSASTAGSTKPPGGRRPSSTTSR